MVFILGPSFALGLKRASSSGSGLYNGGGKIKNKGTSTGLNTRHYGRHAMAGGGGVPRNESPDRFCWDCEILESRQPRRCGDQRSLNPGLCLAFWWKRRAARFWIGEL